MITVRITPDTPSHMLRAIRATCNELLGEMHTDLTAQAAQHVTNANELQAAANAESCKAAAALSAHNATSITIIEPVEDNRQDRVPAVHVEEQAEELDSAGQPWSAELHASTKSKNADGTWKKRRGAGKAEDAPEPPAAAPSLPPLPPAPVVTMNDIYALIQNHKCVLNDVIAGAQAMGFADVGAFSRDATPEQRAQLLQELTA